MAGSRVNKTKKPKSKMSEIEIKQWNELYEYVKDILGYDDKQSLPSGFVLQIKGLLHGKLFANNNTNNNAEYGYNVVLLAFKMTRQNIEHSFKTKNFENETHRFRYMLKIVENSLNDAYMVVKRINEHSVIEKQMLEETNEEVEVVATYKRQTKENKQKISDEFW